MRMNQLYSVRMEKHTSDNYLHTWKILQHSEAGSI